MREHWRYNVFHVDSTPVRKTIYRPCIYKILYKNIYEVIHRAKWAIATIKTQTIVKYDGNINISIFRYKWISGK